MCNKIAIIQDKKAIYPNKNVLLDKNKNEVYSLVENLMYMYDLDRKKYGTDKWNPLGTIINEGDCVLIKPNLVMDVNPAGDISCLYTNPAVVVPIIDYVIKALNGNGRIIVGDAPLQECNFEKLITESGYADVIEKYKSCGVDIELRDFRNTKTYVKNGMHYQQTKEHFNHGTLVHLNEDSAFAELQDDEIQNLRVTNYDSSLMNKHHYKKCHEYMIADEMLQADVVINMPKIKTHRIAGMTAAMKNLIGINANKELLPHHRLGSKEEGGDAYQYKNIVLHEANKLKDQVNKYNAYNQQDKAEIIEHEFQKKYYEGVGITKEKYWNGFWYGNDTIWRTIVDLNRIFLYADKDGVIREDVQRRMLIVGDMIVAGEGEGPLNPTPIYCGTLLMGENPVLFDRIASTLMGFEWQLFPTLNNKYIETSDKPIARNEDIIINSNNLDWMNNSLTVIRDKYSFHFEPTMGWCELLPSRIKKEILQVLHSGKDIYIFGAGKIGCRTYNALIENNITVKGFIDNDKEKQYTEIIDGIECVLPEEVNRDCICILAVGTKFMKEVEIQAKAMKFINVYRWSNIRII